MKRSLSIGTGLTGALPPDIFNLDNDGDMGELLPHDIDGYKWIFGEAVNLGPCEYLPNVFMPTMMR